MNTPIFNYLKEYAKSNPKSFHMPGHKSGNGLPEDFKTLFSEIDVTEIPGADNLHFPEGIVGEAQKLAAIAFGSKNTFFLVNGSTCGIHASILALCNRGDKILVARNSHKSVVSGLFLAGANPVFIQPEFDSDFGISTVILADKVEQSIKENPDIKGVILTSPNFYGVCSDIRKISEIVHKYKKILIVDEAHGSHLAFSNKLPESAIKGGADIVIHSAHKTLPALTQCSYLHINSNSVDIEKIRFYLSIIQTSSPSYILMSSLDIARSIMEEHGETKVDLLINQVEHFKLKVKEVGEYKFLEKDDIKRGGLDTTRLTISMKALGISGYEAEAFLREKHNVQIEMSDIYNIVSICTIANSEDDFEVFLKGLGHLRNEKKENKVLARVNSFNFTLPKSAITICDAIKSEHEIVRFENSAGRVSADMVVPYPPGIPIVCPGEIISDEIIRYVRSIIDLGGKANGIIDGDKISVVK